MVTRRRRESACRLTAMLLCLCMAASILGGFGPFADRALAEPTRYIMSGTRVADPDTMDDYLNRLLSAGSGSRYAGRVWTDKTVFAYHDDNGYKSEHFDGQDAISLNMATDGYNGTVRFDADFAHVFSALASSQVVNEYPPSPVDLVIVFDMSGSMGQDTRYNIDPGMNYHQVHLEDGDTEEWPDEGVPMADRIKHSRVQATLNAINQTIDTLMAQNPQNRVAVCGYGANAVVLMPLGHYRHVDENHDGQPDPYLSVGGMETLYHPSDLVYREPHDELERDGFPAVTKSDWYWMNNRDTCYTVVVNAEMNNYTGILNDVTGDGNSKEGAGDDDLWHGIDKVVSNNVLNSEGQLVKAFPGVADQSKEAGNDDNQKKSQMVYKECIKNHDGYRYAAKTSALMSAMTDTQALKADDYVGYFTNTQGGIYLAYKQLADSAATTYTEPLTNGTISTVARIPAAIIMSDGGANFSFNEMGDNLGSDYRVKDWNLRYGQKQDDSAERFRTDTTADKSAWKEEYDGGDWKTDSWYMNDDLWSAAADSVLNHDVESGTVQEGWYRDHEHRLPNNVGNEWYKVFLPGNDTLAHDKTAEADVVNGYWKGLEGLYNISADYFQDGTLSTQPSWNRAGVLYSSDRELGSTAGAVMEVLLTASYMNQVVKTHYSQGWATHNATEESTKKTLTTYTMNVDTAHVPQWGRWRLFPTLDPKGHPLNGITEQDGDGWNTNLKELGEAYYAEEPAWGAGETFVDTYKAFIRLKETWENWQNGRIDAAMGENGTQRGVIDVLPSSGHTYIAGGTEPDTVKVTNQEVIDNIQYNTEFYDVTSAELLGIFDRILSLILGNVFVPVSGDNDAGVGDSITYQDPLGEYMEIKSRSISATPYHTDENLGKGETVYDMAMLLFGEMHGLVRTGVYDYQWNDAYIVANLGSEAQGTSALTEGWYYGDPVKEAPYAQKLPSGCSSAADAWEKGWVYRLNYKTIAEYVPILAEAGSPGGLSDQAKNTVYTIYRFDCSSGDRGKLRRNPIYGSVPEDVLEEYKDSCFYADGFSPANGYPDHVTSFPLTLSDASEDVASTPGVYRLSDIRVWVEDTGDYVDVEGAITPESGYDRSLYLNVPAAAVPTELAEITLGRDGVLSYKTNLGGDHTVGTMDTDDDGETVPVGDDRYRSYCYQSTPLRLFYAVGLEEDLILRDEESKAQTAVDISAISREYIDAHTETQTGNIWFISNYYSNTSYEDYVTDTQDTRTRGDPTVTFSPSSDNRYYVFQKPLPLYAHAYRVGADGVPRPVDDANRAIWTQEDNRQGGNGKTAWETVNGVQQQAGSWTGGQFMGVYTNGTTFATAYAAAKAAGEGKITDDHGTIYPLVENGIVFKDEDVLEHVTSNSSGYAEGSTSFSSDDYFFLLVEFYLPDNTVTGKNNQGVDVPGTKGGRSVQYALARKGSEFGSAFHSANIDNGDMLCWTDTNNRLNVEFEYLSRTDTGDDTRGEPTYEKLFYQGDRLENYLKSLHIHETEDVEIDDPAHPESKAKTSYLELQKQYWEDMQTNNEIVKAQIAAVRVRAAELGDANDEAKLRAAFKELFRFAVAARRGGIRTGDMANNRQAKTANVTSTAYSYYLPSVSENSSTDNSVILNNYLGNNGRLAVANSKLLVTKMIEGTPGIPLPTGEDGGWEDETFLYQLYVQGVTGEQNATRVYRDPLSGTWRRRVAYIDVLTDNSDLLMTSSNERALFDFDVRSRSARHVVASGADASGMPVYYYANEDGTPGDERCEKELSALYYLYLPPNTDPDAAAANSAHSRRLYQDGEYDGSDKINKLNEGNRMTIYYGAGQEPSKTQQDEDKEKGINYGLASENRPAGTQAYWAQHAEMIPVSVVQEAETPANGEAAGDGPVTSALSENVWHHEESGNYQECSYTLVVSRPAGETSENDVASPFKTRSMYMTKVIVFGQNANDKALEGKAGHGEAGSALTADDLYDEIIPKGDRPDLFGAQSAAGIARNTAEFTLKSGEALLLTGLANRVAYRYTEKLTEAQLAAGYTLKTLTHIQQRGSESIYRPGVQEIPVYSRDGATYGPCYPEAYQGAQTQYGLTWALDQSGAPNDSEYLHYEPFHHTNAVMWEYYATMAAGASGNHHQPADAGAAAPEVADFFLWNAATGENAAVPGVRDTVENNPSCRPLEEGGCDVALDDGSTLHYMYREGRLVDPHYEGEASAYLRNMSRYGVSPTVHFGVNGETQAAAQSAPPAQPSTAYNGVYSAFGNTGYFEEQSHFVNTVVKNALSVDKWVRADADSELTAEDRESEFEFTLNLYGEHDEPLSGPYLYVVTRHDAAARADEILTHGVLYAGSFDPGMDTVTGGAQAHIPKAEDGWHFRLKDGQTITVSGLPGNAPYTYAVEETQSGPFTPNRAVATRRVDPSQTGVMTAHLETFINLKRPPEPARLDLPLTKTLIDPCGKYDWRAKPFLFTVTPSRSNPVDDPVRKLSGYDAASNRFSLSTGGDAFASGESATLTVFDGLPYARAGTYHYLIAEQLPSAPEESMRYDGSVYQVTVDVSPAPDAPAPGRLEATVTIAEGGERKAQVAFENHCDRPPDLPLTGDGSRNGLWLALAALSCLLMRAAWRRRAGENGG